LVVLVIFVTAGQVFAITFYNYNLTVPRLGYATTGNQAKETACSNISLYVTAVGANYSLIAKAEDGSSNYSGRVKQKEKQGKVEG